MRIFTARTGRCAPAITFGICLALAITASISGCKKQAAEGADPADNTPSLSKLIGGDRIMPSFAQYTLDGVKTVHAKGHSEYTAFDFRIASGQPFTAEGHYQRRIETGGTMDYDFRFVANQLYLRPRNLFTGVALITGSDTHHTLTEKWEKAQAARILGKWVLGVSSNNRLNGNITIDRIKPFGVFSYNSVGGFDNDKNQLQRSDKTVDGVKVAAFRKPNGDELDLALAGDHRPVRSIYKSNGNSVTHFSDYDAPLHVEAPANPIDLSKLQ